MFDDTYICPDCTRRCYLGTPHQCGPNSLAHAPSHEEKYTFAGSYLLYLGTEVARFEDGWEDLGREVATYLNETTE